MDILCCLVRVESTLESLKHSFVLHQPNSCFHQDGHNLIILLRCPDVHQIWLKLTDVLRNC